MKKITITVFSLLFCTHYCISQLAPFPAEGMTIGSVYFWNNFNGYTKTNRSLEYIGDTVICNKDIHKFYMQNSGEYFLFYDDGRVYFHDYWTPCEPGDLVYDFNLEVGDTVDTKYFPVSVVTETGMLTIDNGEERKYLKLEALPPLDDWPEYQQTWIDGIGDVKFGLLSRRDFEGGFTGFVCAKDVNGLLYYNDSYNIDCDSLLCDPPVPRFNYECNGLTIAFENLSEYASGYLWDFGDGVTSTEFSPLHTYSAPGCYEVTLAASTDCLPFPFEKIRTVPADFSAPFKPVYDLESQRVIDIAFISENMGWVITSGFIYKTMDGGENWLNQFETGSSQYLSSISAYDENNVAVSLTDYNSGNSNLLLISQDGGMTWNQLPFDNNINVRKIKMLSESKIYGISNFNDFVKSENGGSSWTNIEIPLIKYNYDIQVVDSTFVFIVGRLESDPGEMAYHFSKSNDAGLNWTTYNLSIGTFPNSVFFMNEQEGWIVGDSSYLLHTIDGGEYWDVQKLDDKSDRLTEIVFTSNDKGWIVGHDNIVHTIDGGQTWINQSCGTSDYRKRAMSFVSDSLGYIGCSLAEAIGGAVLKHTDAVEGDCGFVATKEVGPTIDFEIYPNPSSGRVVVSKLESSGFTDDFSVVVFNTNGQIIKENLWTPNVDLTFDLSEFPNGLYFVMIKNGIGRIGYKKLALCR